MSHMLPSIATIDKSVADESLCPSWTVYLNFNTFVPLPAINWALASLDKSKLTSYPHTCSLNTRLISILSPIL